MTTASLPPELVPRLLAALATLPVDARPDALVPYLNEHGEPLELALRALPEEQRIACGIDAIEVEVMTVEEARRADLGRRLLHRPEWVL